jgi:hypothetical protein
MENISRRRECLFDFDFGLWLLWRPMLQRPQLPSLVLRTVNLGLEAGWSAPLFFLSFPFHDSSSCFILKLPVLPSCHLNTPLAPSCVAGPQSSSHYSQSLVNCRQLDPSPFAFATVSHTIDAHLVYVGIGGHDSPYDSICSPGKNQSEVVPTKKNVQ